MTPQGKERAKGTILILVEESAQEHQDYRFHQRILRFLNHKKNDDRLIIRKFKTVSKLAELLQKTEKEVSFSDIYIFLGQLNYFKIIDYHKKIFEITKQLKKFSRNHPRFYLYETSFLVNFFYHPFLKYVSNIHLIKNTKELLKNLEPHMKYHIYEFDYEKKRQKISLNAKKKYSKMRVQCIPYWNSEKISLKKNHKDKADYRVMPPPIHQVIPHESSFYCLFENKQKKIIYKIIYPKIDFSLFPREVLIFYEPKKIVEKEISISISSGIEVKNLEPTIQVNKFKGKPPLLFSHNQKWNWNQSSRKFSIANQSNRKELHQFNLENKYIIDLAIIGKENNSLSGILQLASEGFTLAKFPINFRPYFWGANLLYILLIYLNESLLLIVLLLIGVMFFLTKKKKKVDNNMQPGEAIGEFILMIKKPRQFFLSKNDNPFNCMIPFIDESYVVKVDGAYIDIKKDDRKEKESFNLNESLGKIQYKLGERGEVLFSQEKFYEKNNQFVIIMKVREKVT